jgi:hypothetical protein
MKRIQWPTAIVTVVFVLAITAAYLAGPALGVPEDSHKALVAGIGVLAVPVLAMMQKLLAPRGEQ